MVFDQVSLSRPDHPSSINAPPSIQTAYEFAAQIGQIERGRPVAIPVYRPDGPEQQSIRGARNGRAVANQPTDRRRHHGEMHHGTRRRYTLRTLLTLHTLRTLRTRLTRLTLRTLRTSKNR